MCAARRVRKGGADVGPVQTKARRERHVVETEAEVRQFARGVQTPAREPDFTLVHFAEDRLVEMGQEAAFANQAARQRGFSAVHLARSEQAAP